MEGPFYARMPPSLDVHLFLLAAMASSQAALWSVLRLKSQEQ